MPSRGVDQLHAPARALPPLLQRQPVRVPQLRATDCQPWGGRGQFNSRAAARQSPRLRSHHAAMHSEPARERYHAHHLCAGCSH